MIRLLAIFLLLLSMPLLAQSDRPDTPAGKVFREWLNSFNSADAEQLRIFKEKYKRTTPVAYDLAWHEETGGFDVLRIVKNEPTSIGVLMKEKESDNAVRMDLTIAAGTPTAIKAVEVNRASLPPELAVRRLTQSEALAALVTRANALKADDRFSGALLIARHDEILLQRAWGFADREAKIPSTTDTRFRLGSANKMFTSVAILQLVEAGKLSLDDTVAKHLPGYPNKEIASNVTLRQLLTHSGGTGDIFGPKFDANRLSLKTHGDYLKLYGSRGLAHKPGAKYEYSNYGFILLAALIEKASGMSYYEYVQRRIFDPAGMAATGSQPESKVVPDRARGYMKRQGKWVSSVDTLPYRGTAAGGGYSTLGDLLKFSRALSSGRLLSKAMLAEASTAKSPWYGYGFGVHGEGRLKYYGHGGGADGMNSDIRIYPELGYVLVGLSNLDPPAASRLIDHYAFRMPTVSQ